MKKHIPNILTTFRLLVALSIPFLILYGNYNTLIFLFLTAILSDLLDGFLARKWNATSTYGKIVDVIGDKALSILTSLTLIFYINKWYIVTLIMEIIILLINLIKYIKDGSIKNKNFSSHSSSLYGKIKTWFIFITLSIGLISNKINYLRNLVTPSIFVTLIIQIITAFDYYKKPKTT